MINAIWYVVVGEIQWRLLPHGYPHAQSVYPYVRTYASQPVDISIRALRVCTAKASKRRL